MNKILKCVLQYKEKDTSEKIVTDNENSTEQAVEYNEKTEESKIEEGV